MKKLMIALAVLGSVACIDVSLAQTAVTTTPSVAVQPVPATPTIENAVSLGTVAGTILTWVAAIASIPIAGFLTNLVFNLMKGVGLAKDEALRQKLQDIIVNGLHWGATFAKEKLDGKMTVDVKNAIVAKAVQYAQDHGADTIKALGGDPHSPETKEILIARAEAAISDPAVSTPIVEKPAVVSPKA